MQGSADSEARCWLGRHTALSLSRDQNGGKDQMAGADQCRGVTKSL